MVTIMHACGSHAGKHYKDIVEEPWRLTHKYQYVAIPRSDYLEIGQHAVDIGRLIIANNKTGKFQYSQSAKRWNLYKNISRYMSSNGCTLSVAIEKCTDPNLQCDCSSFLLTLYKWAGLPYVGTWQTYTGGMKTVLKNSKCFDIHNTSDYTRCPDHAVPGALYWKENAHTVMACEFYGAPDIKPEPEKPMGDTLEILSGTFYIRSQGSTKGKILGVAKKGDVFELIDKPGWYHVKYEGTDGYITDAYPKNMRVNHEEQADQEVVAGVPYIVVSGGTLRIRSGPGRTYKTLGFTNETEKYYVISQTENNWYEVVYGAGVGYISGNTVYTIYNAR